MKNKKFILLIILLLVFTLVLNGCGKTTDGDKDKSPPSQDLVDKDPVNKDFYSYQLKNQVDPKIKAYKVNPDLSNIENLDAFGEFSKDQIELLVKNNFVVNPTMVEQIFYIYEDNEYKWIPSFVTTDSILQIYHVFYDFTLRTLEEENLLGEIEDLTGIMLYNAIRKYNEIDNPYIKSLQEKNIAFFATGQMALGNTIPKDLPENARIMAENEFEKIERHSNFEDSFIFPFKLDYSQFTVRGHYTRNEDLARYFKALMWYGQAPFPLLYSDGTRAIDETIQAILISDSILNDAMAYEKWEKVYRITEFFVGSSDDLDIDQYGQIIRKVYGDKLDYNSLDDEGLVDKFYEETKDLPEPKIQAKYTSLDTPVGKQLRFMGQRYIMDSEIIQELVEPLARPIPSGLDVLSVFGSKRAKEIQVSKEINQNWELYPIKLDEMEEKFSKLEEKDWNSNMYTGWLWTLQGLLKEYKEGYPSFMTNEAWVDKDLNSALGSWAELKHDTVLYGKQSGAEMGGGDDTEIVGSYVEPNLEVYEKLQWLIDYSLKALRDYGLSSERLEDSMENFQDLLDFLISCSVKELNNESLNKEENMRLLLIGGWLESLSSSFVEGVSYWYEITSETDRNMAIIGDYHTVAPNPLHPGGYMEAGVGPAYEIYVVVPVGDKLYLSRGGVFSFHEFLSPERLTDEKWQDLLKDGLGPDLMPEWTQSFIRGGKGEIPYPDYDW